MPQSIDLPYNSFVTDHPPQQPERPPRPPRTESREVVGLKQLKADHPELADAVDMQLALVEMQRRVQARVPLPWIQANEDWQRAQRTAGRPLVRFSDIPLEWSDFRLTFRQTADILRRHQALEPDEYDRIVALSREGNVLQTVVGNWYAATSHVEAGDVPARIPADAPASLEHVLVLALRPFLARAAEVLVQRVDLSDWQLGICPCCGWEPDFAVITPTADRRLICGRCLAQWVFPALKCPFCTNEDPSRITSFATRDGQYRVSACDVCQRYLKAYDARSATRPVMVALDTIATLPLDAAAMQRGYVG